MRKKSVEPKKLAIIKNLQFWSYQADILVTTPTHKLVFDIKFNKYQRKIVDF